MSKGKATLITQHGTELEVHPREAHAMLRHGQVERISDRPLVVKILRFPIFDEELRYLSGRRVEGVHHKSWAGKVGMSASQHRCRPPRKAIYPDADERYFRRAKRLYFNRLDDKRWDAVDS